MSTLHRQLIQMYAADFAERVAGAAVSALLKSPHSLSGDDSGLHTTWDEICVQVQGEESAYWQAYDSAMADAVRSALLGASRQDLISLWLRTDEGWDWHYDQQHADAAPAHPVDLDAVPVDDEVLVRYVVRHHLLRMAGEDDRPAVRRFLSGRHGDRPYDNDAAMEQIDAANACRTAHPARFAVVEETVELDLDGYFNSVTAVQLVDSLEDAANWVEARRAATRAAVLSARPDAQELELAAEEDDAVHGGSPAAQSRVRDLQIAGSGDRKRLVDSRNIWMKAGAFFGHSVAWDVLDLAELGDEPVDAALLRIYGSPRILRSYLQSNTAGLTAAPGPI